MSISREDNSNTRQALLFPPAKVEATQDTIAAIDISGYESALFTAIVGASDVDLDGDNSIQFELQHSDENVPDTFIACDNHDLINSVVGENTGTFAVVDAAVPVEGLAFKCAYKGHKRFVRPLIRCSGADHGNDAHGTIIGVSAILRGTKYRPVVA